METTAPRGNTVSLRNIRLTALFKPSDVICHSKATTDAQVIREMLERLALQYGIGNVDAAFKEVMDNLTSGNVNVGPELAFPHARLNLEQLRIAIATSENGVEMGGERVKLFILMLIPTSMPGAYLQTLQTLSKICDKPEVAAKVAAMNSALEIWQFFDSGGHRLPDHLQAKHIMTPCELFLKENDSLAQAIDLFLRHNASELPVLDAEGELVGVVTTSQLVKVCMPEYLMWVEDMTPFLNFEPFADVIRHEYSTWLNDIMTDDYAMVTEDEPAVKAVREIGRHESEYAYVLRDRKLMGVIRLHEFLRCVLR